MLWAYAEERSPEVPGLVMAREYCQRRWWHLTPVLLPGKSHGRRSLVGCSPWDCKESDTTERFHFHFSLSCIGEGNCNPLQCSCLENPRDGGAWWAAFYGVAQSQTRLKRLISSSSSSSEYCKVVKLTPVTTANQLQIRPACHSPLASTAPHSTLLLHWLQTNA